MVAPLKNRIKPANWPGLRICGRPASFRSNCAMAAMGGPFGDFIEKYIDVYSITYQNLQ